MDAAHDEQPTMSSGGPSRPLSADDISTLGCDLGRQLATLRATAGLTQQQLAKAVGYARGTVSAVECGRFDQARRFWQQCDRALHANGQLVGRFDEIRTLLAAQRRQQARLAQAERDARLSNWRQASDQHALAEHQPPACSPEVAGTDVHIWFTTTEGVTHCLIIPRARVSVEALAEELRKALDI